jgi:hypothetical protein
MMGMFALAALSSARLSSRQPLSGKIVAQAEPAGQRVGTSARLGVPAAEAAPVHRILAPREEKQDIRFCMTADGVRIAP